MLIGLAAVCAAVVPLAASQRTSWFQRLLNRVKKSAIVAPAPPVIENDAGWQLLHSEDLQSFNDWLGKDSMGLPSIPNEEPSLGSHLLIELFDCDKAALEKELPVGKAMMDAARASEATIVTDSFHEFKPFGVSGAVIIQESHYTIHTWPEHGYAAVDLFYCGGTIYVDRAVEVLKDRFKPGRIKFLVVRRGIQSEVSG
ncbi:MAG: adenosylmethionine decarboxylase [Fimbriimonadaceae bacterium]|jgi:S-adenosylmethionine decarboxylase|nr:adenosylmethionine decarboxylase [Fimbriimonadaceae bacterium]